MPEGYSLRTWRSEDEGLWLDVQRDAEILFKVEESLFAHEFGYNSQLARERVLFIVDSRGVAAGTLSLWEPHEEFDASYGRIHWVAVRSAHQGKGLAKAALCEALRRMREWHSRSYLLTSSARLAAVKVYLDLGFRPDLRPEDAAAAWDVVRQHLHHSAIRGEPAEEANGQGS